MEERDIQEIKILVDIKNFAQDDKPMTFISIPCSGPPLCVRAERCQVIVSPCVAYSWHQRFYYLDHRNQMTTRMNICSSGVVFLKQCIKCGIHIYVLFFMSVFPLCIGLEWWWMYLR